MESTSGLLLIVAAIFAIILANSSLSSYYHAWLNIPVEVHIGGLHIAKPLVLWINDGLMAVFFFLVGLELKRELLEGELSHPKQLVLPAVGAIGGMVVPALIYLFINRDSPETLDGWAIPAATDIAFALAILGLLGSRVPTSVKIFLTSLAIFDDIGAILIIAIFYTANISWLALTVVACCLPILFLLNRSGVVAKSLYILVGLVMWVATLKSGIHATLTGVILAMFIPLRTKPDVASPLHSLEHDLHHVVAFFVLPMFAFANSGIVLSGISFDYLMHPVPLGISLGLLLGKQIGIFGLCWLAIKTRLASMPHGVNWLNLYGTSIVCGIGFTMSMFIGSLAFEESAQATAFDERLGIIIGSLASAIIGYLVLRYSLPEQTDSEDT